MPPPSAAATPVTSAALRPSQSPGSATPIRSTCVCRRSQRSSSSFAADNASGRRGIPLKRVVLDREQRFRLWELPGGRTVVTSRPIEPNVAKRPQLRLSARGNFVLVFWKYGDKPLLVYQVP